MRAHMTGNLLIALIAFLVWVISLPQAMPSAYADVTFRKFQDEIWVNVTNTISKADANLIVQHSTDFEYYEMMVWLDSSGGDVDAAMQIGRIIRQNDGETRVAKDRRCYSSCALLYIAGVSRENFGVVGFHRPYFASTPQKRQDIERQVPLMLQKLQSYVQEMGITDNAYHEMVNTEPSNMKLYDGQDVYKLVLGIASVAVELGKEALPTFEPLGSGCRIRKGEQRHDDCYHAFIAHARAQP